MRGGWEQGGEGQIATVRTVTYSELIQRRNRGGVKENPAGMEGGKYRAAKILANPQQ